jgi:hypothetical protein
MTVSVPWDRKLKTALEAVYKRGSLWLSQDERSPAPYRAPEIREWVRLSPAVMQAQGRSIQGVLITPRFDLPTWTTTLHYAAETWRITSSSLRALHARTSPRRAS